MKKIGAILLCISLCVAIAFVFPQLGTSNSAVDDSGCLVEGCHAVGEFGADDGTLHGEHGDCSACHVETGDTPASSACLDCHPALDSALCDLADYHEDSLSYNPSGASCYTCHPECDEEPTTTTTEPMTSTTTTAITGASIEVAPQSQIRSQFFVLVGLQTIKGTGTQFGLLPDVQYSSDDVIPVPFPLVNQLTQEIFQVIVILPWFLPDVADETVTVTVDGLTDTFRLLDLFF